MTIRLQFESAAPTSSIRQFDPIELPSFSVLTGVNGAGKTHLLKAIDGGHVAVDGISHLDVSYFDYRNFRAPDSSSFTSQQIEAQRNTVWTQLNGQGGVNWRNKFWNIMRQHLGANPSEELFAAIWQPSEREGLNQDQLGKVAACRTALKQQFKNARFKKIPHFASVIKLICKLRKPFNQITQNDFRDLFVPSTKQAESHLAGSLGVVFTKYKVNQFLWCHEQWEKGGAAISPADLHEKYHELHARPWETMNEILQQIHAYAGDSQVFNFRITDPGPVVLRMDSWQAYTFVPQLVDCKLGQPRSFEALSSGEQVLLSLAISIFESRDDFQMPDLLLLDEVDASLHPSMSRALLETVKSVFVAKGTKVILATHSPSTVALAPVDAIYVVNRGPVRDKIAKACPRDAVELLTEGYATLEEGLSIFNEISKHDCCIITEGRNANHIRKALDVLKIKNVEVAKGVESITGWTQLKTLYQFFLATSHKTNVLFVWDNDCKNKCGNLEEGPHTFRLVLPDNPKNTLAPKGIENMYPDHMFENFVKTSVDSRGSEDKQFDPTRKNDFERHVIANGGDGVFSEFSCVAEKIMEILDATKQTAAVSATRT